MDVHWVILSQVSIIDGTTNQLTIVNITEAVTGKNLPIALPKLCINMRLVGDPNETGELGITLFDPDGSVVGTTGSPVRLGDRGMVTTYIAVKPVVFHKVGMHEIRISINGEPKSSASFDVLT